jgi:hypothetical protein
MNNEGGKPGMAFWAAVVVVVLAVGYMQDVFDRRTHVRIIAD